MADPQAVASALTILLVVLLVAAIVLQIDTVRSVKCKECPHCQKIVADKEWATAKAAHMQYHGYTTAVPGCEFCRMDNKTE